MIYVLQVLEPWVSSTTWKSVAAFDSPEEARSTALWAHGRDVRLIEIPACGSLKRLLET